MSQEDYLQDIADAIREKEKSVAPIPATAFAERVRGLPSGGTSILKIGIYWSAQYSDGIVEIPISSVGEANLLFVIINGTMHQADTYGACAYKTTNGIWMAQTVTSSGTSEFSKGIFTSTGDNYRWAVNPDNSLPEIQMLMRYRMT